jgi:hypothetical protein
MPGHLCIVRGVNAELSQRQERGRTRWKAPGDVFNPYLFEVAPIATDTEADAFVMTHHYSRSSVAACRRFGVYDWRGALQGVAIFSAGMNRQSITNVFGEPQLEQIEKLRARGQKKLPTYVPGAPEPWREAFELGRFVLRDAVPYNAESWFLARCFELLRRGGVRGVVSFSDPYPRQRLDGSTAFVGHWGQIYQASNATYTGRGTQRTLRLLPDGLVFDDRSAQKVRGAEHGWREDVAQLERAGAEQYQPGEDRAEWLARALKATTRRMPHPGNHRYVFGLERHAQLQLPACVRPKMPDAA